ncbi:4-coumarate--CoA ligase 1-like [Cimex lectularius]|uniref:Luciferin 4-monooxygenase n=1 Tax=Cimex lectularius TaxID=79782 RepID=A0A8I6SAX1_CIMLE|nr:4-coumarate--CoA ligase 1-like [Cimex lectularius]
MPLAGSPLPSHFVGQSIIKCALDKLKQNGKSVFLIDESTGEHYTYLSVLQMSTSIAVRLQKMGIGRNSVVSSLIDNSGESVSFQFGIWIAGGISNPINHFLNPAEVRTCIMTSRPAIIFCGNQYLKVVEESIQNIGWNITIITKHKVSQYLSYDDLLNEDISNVSVEIDDPAKHFVLAVFTSGTTGVPKAVKMSDENMYKRTLLFHTWNKFSRVLLTSPMFWISNPFTIKKALLNGMTVILPADCNARGLMKCITNLKPECWFTGPSVLIEMCSLPNLHEYDTTSMKYVLLSGSYISLAHKHLIRKCVFNDNNVLHSAYGSSEAGFVSCFENQVPVDCPEYGSVGQVIPGMTVKITDLESGKEQGPREEGEICVKSDYFMAGYMNKNLETTDLDSEGWWHMGDAGYYDEKGYLYFTSRIKEIMKYRGVQISPFELEAILYRHPDVIEASIVGKPHDIDGDWPTAFVVKRSNSPLTENELCAIVEENVSDSKKLRGGVHFLPSLPKSAVGKILHGELKKMLKKN